MIQSTLLAALEAAFQSAVTAEVESQLTGIRQHFANTVGELAAKVASLEHAVEMKELDYATLAESLSDEQLRQIARRVSPSDIAGSVDWSEEIDYSEITAALDYSELASELNYSELAGEVDAEQLASALDLDQRLREILSGRSVTIQL